MRPGSTLTAAEVIELLHYLPEGTALIAALQSTASGEPASRSGESAEVTAFRKARRWRGWTGDRQALFDIRDGLFGKPSPRPWDADGVAVSDRRVVEEMPI